MKKNGPITTVDLLRHGEPVGGRRVRGSTDDPLTRRGWKQMRTVTAGACTWDAVVSSPLVRCAAFAQELARVHSLPLHVDGRLQEMHFGLWEGRHPLKLLTSEPRGIARLMNDPARFAPPGAESIAEFRKRVSSAWSEHLARYPGRRLLFICHGGTIRMILSLTLQTSMRTLVRLNLPHASLTRIVVTTDDSGRAVPTLAFHGRRAACGSSSLWRRMMATLRANGRQATADEYKLLP